MDDTSGISGSARSELSRLVGRGKRLVTVDDAVSALGTDRHDAAVRLNRWARQGWLRRVRRGLYIPVPIDAEDPASWTEDPFVLADEVWAPCYMSGWTSANHWGLTEQVFQTTVVKTARRVRKSEQTLLDHRYLVAHVAPDKLGWGTKRVWRDDRAVLIADPARTVADMFDAPAIGGGIRHCAEVLDAFLDDGDEHELIECVERLGNRAVFKRIGYVLSVTHPDRAELIEVCATQTSRGTSLLDPALPNSGRWSRRWGLRINAQIESGGHS